MSIQHIAKCQGTTRTSIDALLTNRRSFQAFANPKAGANSGLNLKKTINEEQQTRVFYPPKDRNLTSPRRRRCHLESSTHLLFRLSWSPLTRAAPHARINSHVNMKMTINGEQRTRRTHQAKYRILVNPRHHHRYHHDPRLPNHLDPAAQAEQRVTLDTSRSLYSRESDAIIVFSDTEWGMGIVTKDLDIPALLRLGRNFDTGQSSFDWITGKPTL